MPYYDSLLSKFRHLSRQKQIIKLFEAVRDIPYGECLPRSPQNTLKFNKGTCSTKNIILRDLYRAIGIPVQTWLCSFEYYPSKRFTPVMNALLKKPLRIYHTFIKIKIGKKWVLVDATNDPGLGKKGIPYQKKWDGKSDTLLAVKPIAFFHAEDSEAFKERQFARRSKKELQRKEKFMKLFFAWVDRLRR